MSGHKTGHLAEASNWSRAKRHVEDTERKRARLVQQIEAVEAAKRQLAETEIELHAARQAFQREQRKVDTEHFAELALELDQVLARLDGTGSTPADEARVSEILAECRLNGRSGQSSEALRAYVERMKNGATFVDRRLRWSGLLSWIKKTTEGVAV